ncbi:DUF5803 family protein [Haloarcula sp. H-GB4]|uniref:DUF5803 family protein n=1 Tax=Haloarcula sp. H-GB4 TaxID=3069755 RepID=UPI0027B5D9DD|nr:DUF5803 family protein [Haloarcula sp. H-GB4]MDQ2072154.1 DUF5803 family protein [Haloarcula sp. H-GB4]
MKRRHLLLVAVLALVALSGCSGFFGSEEVDPERLNENASYDWNTSADGTIVIKESKYTAVYAVENETTFDVYTVDGLGRERSVPISALRFRYENGTVVSANESSLSASESRQRTTVNLSGNVSGKVGYSVARTGKRFASPTLVEDGSYTVVLPPNTGAGIPFLSRISPGGYESETVDGQQVIRWDEVTSDQIVVRYYLDRDLWLFGGLSAIAIVIGVVGTVYYYRQLQAVIRRRKEAGIDLEEDGDDDDPRDRGPPPGMR